MFQDMSQDGEGVVAVMGIVEPPLPTLLHKLTMEVGRETSIGVVFCRSGSFFYRHGLRAAHKAEPHHKRKPVEASGTKHDTNLPDLDQMRQCTRIPSPSAATPPCNSSSPRLPRSYREHSHRGGRRGSPSSVRGRKSSPA